MEHLPDNIVSVDFSKGRLKTRSESQIANPPPLNLEKRRVFEELLQHGIVSVAFDPRVAGVKVPSQHQKLNHMVLNFSFGYRIPDFGFDDFGVRATLTFPEGYFFCDLLWEAVFSLHSDPLEKSSYWHQSEPVMPHLTLVEDDSSTT